MGGCSNGIFKDTTITSIEIMKFASDSPSPEEYREQKGEIISIVESENEIKEIINAIERAKQESTETANLALPNYLLLFKENENVFLALGYYLGVHSKDRFFDISKQKMYETSELNLTE